jgi:signal transduction histidine kinase/DNA-binding response OmpR family regulator
MVFTDFKLFNESLIIGKDSPLKQDITLTKEIHLQHWQNDIAIEATAIHYINPKANQYRFWLENYDADWRDNGTNRIANYTNLDPGEYIFHAKGANSHGCWNEQPISLRIFIHPPWWATTWAYVFYILLIGGIIVTAWKLQLRRIKLRNDLKMREFESAQLKKVDHLKSRFFANISHEFRTPITLIKGPLEKLFTMIKDKAMQKELTIMQRNANRLHRLINQLLDMSALEAGKLELNTSTQDIVRLVRYFVQSFESQAKLKEIELSFTSETNELYAVIDKDKIEDIVYNLLSNALKFTKKCGEVKVHVAMRQQPNEHADKWFEIRVSDTGIGIPADRLVHIFDRFYQVDDSFIREAQGSGIGLSLTKELVELHKGSINVNSTPGIGSIFTVRLPVSQVDIDDASDTPHEPLTIVEEVVPEIQNEKKSGGKPLVLIVEDNADLRAFVRNVMQNDFQFYEAPDGQTGFDLAKKTVPDLIISDIMMPKMDGYQLCEKLKTDQLTSHIPVILLTARASKESKLEGLETGADDYLIKPFDADELNVRVKNLIRQRQLLREQFAKKLSVDPADIAVTSADERFLKRALDILEKRISDADFTAEQFAIEVGLSRPVLYRKLRGLTGQTISEFIRSIRLKRAAQLIKQKNGNISEIAYQVGFNHLSYFAACFKKQFGVAPKDFK